MERNGPTSLPLGLITPMVAASYQQDVVLGDREQDPRQHHQAGAGDQHALAADAVGVGGDPQ